MTPAEEVMSILMGVRERREADQLEGELRLVARDHGIDSQNVTRLMSGPLAWVQPWWGCEEEGDSPPETFDVWCMPLRPGDRRWPRWRRRGRLVGRSLELVRLWARDRHGLTLPEHPGKPRCAHCGQTLREQRP